MECVMVYFEEIVNLFSVWLKGYMSDKRTDNFICV